MKKITKKLSLNKETVASLDRAEMNKVRGGNDVFTYTLSLGERCIKSGQVGGDGPTCKCG